MARIREVLIGVRAAVLFVAMLAAPSVAHATIVTVTYAGTLVYGYDDKGAFGVPGGSLTGDAYSLVFSYDTAVGILVASPALNSARGGLSFGPGGPASPSLGAVLTINGVSVSTLGNWEGLIQGYNSGVSSSTYHRADSFTDDGHFRVEDRLYNSIQNLGAAIPAAIDQPFFYQATANDIAQGSFQFRTRNLSDASFLVNVEGVFAPQSVRVALVPEPTTWALMITGFGLTGLMMRRRRSVTA